MYTKLSYDAVEFRLLTLQPGRNDDHIFCSLSPASMTSRECPAYETISYHWGGLPAETQRDDAGSHGGSDQQCIHVAGHQVAVPARAAQALRCMRLPDKPRTLWIDSICINQSDVQEREQQIAIMGDIYKNGVRNLVHLDAGNREEASAGVAALKVAFSRLQDELKQLPEEAQNQWREYRIKPAGWGKLEKPPHLLKNPGLVKSMFKCAWFTRLWIVQETCLASENICHWADEHFNLQDLMDVVHISRELEVSGDDNDPDIYKTYCCLQQLRYPLLLSRQFRTGDIDNTIEALMTLVDVLRHCDVRQPHDRIFAMVGLLRSLPGYSREAMRLLEADYKKPQIAVFRDATRAILLLSGTDDLLTKATHRNASELLDTRKPSWSFYWDRAQDLVYEAGRPTLSASFCAGKPAGGGRLNKLAIGTEIDPDILSLRGTLVGPVLNFIPFVSGGALHRDYNLFATLIETISDMAKAQLSSQWCQASGVDTFSLDEREESEVVSEALRLRELERAHEVVRRRLSRKVGDMQILAYEELNRAKLDSTSVVQAEPSVRKEHPPTRSIEDFVDMTIITVLSAGWYATQFPDEQSALEAFRDLRNHMETFGELPHILEDAFNMFMMLCSCSNNRCFFTTVHGDVGCGPKIMESEDVVAVFLGAKYPYILRPTGPFDGTYRFVGMAVIPGIMHGEALRRGLQQETIRVC